MTIRVTAANSLALSAVVLPLFLFGALSGAIGADLGFGSPAAGAAGTLFFVAAGMGAIPSGRLTDRIGTRAAARLGVAVSASACLGIAFAAQRWWHVAGLLIVAGSIVGLIDTGAARAFATVIRPARRGLAFGIKEASVPVASMLAGVAVPLLAVRAGWQATFGAAALLAPVVWLALPAEDPRPERAAVLAGSRRRLRAMLAVTAGVGLGAGCATAGAVFLVPGAVAAGRHVSTAGFVLAVASLLSVGARVVLGWWADRTQRPPVRTIAAAMVLGAVGAGLLAGGGDLAMVLGALLLLGAGWGWTGLAFLTAVRLSPDAPASAAGIVLTGLAVGGTIGPAAFGAAVAAWSYDAAWVVVGIGLLLGALLTGVAGERVWVDEVGRPG